jgi:uncharacterized protein YbbC (DUF1343 family)
MPHRSPASWNCSAIITRLRRLGLFAVCLGAFVAPTPAHSVSRGKANSSPVLVGIDVLESQDFAPLRGKHIGIITNHTGVDSQGRTTVDVLTHTPDVHVVALFSPEHGLVGRLDDKVDSTKDTATGLPVYSLYGDTRRPTAEMLKGIDALVFDIQDAGVRFYTYTTTMAYCMEEAARHNIAFFVLDRPNPLGGEIVEGPLLDQDKTSFTGYFPLPVRYGLTIGELAQFLNTESNIHCILRVIAMRNWRREEFFAETGLNWIPPSPNLRTLNGSILYPGLEILQNAGLSVGRGTDAPFEQFGAPWMDGQKVAALLSARRFPGLRFDAAAFTPDSDLYKGQLCQAVAVRITDKRKVRSMEVGLAIASILHDLYPQQFHLEKMMFLVANAATIDQLNSRVSPQKILQSWKTALDAFESSRRKYLLYP